MIRIEKKEGIAMTEERKKRYYSISEVANMVGIKAHILRYWEGEFSMLRPRKNRAGNRAYTERDIKIALQIKKLLYEEKYTIKGAINYLKSNKEEIETDQIEIPFEASMRKNEMKEIRSELCKLRDMIQDL
ncbi:MerR family transcriptional regulator [Candidatus Latescibacterota bacterium]